MIDNKIKVISHRGFHQNAIENSYDSFEKAICVGAYGIETDVRLTKDGISILHHDRALKNGMLIADLDYDEICKLAKFDVPMLDIALQKWPNIFWNIEIKTPESADPALNIINKYKHKTKFLISSFWHNVIEYLSDKTDAELGLLYANHPVDGNSILAKFLNNHRIRNIIWDYEIVTKEILYDTYRMGFINYIYGVTNFRELKGLDQNIAGIITDRPDLFL